MNETIQKISVTLQQTVVLALFSLVDNSTYFCFRGKYISL